MSGKTSILETDRQEVKALTLLKSKPRQRLSERAKFAVKAQQGPIGGNQGVFTLISNHIYPK